MSAASPLEPDDRAPARGVPVWAIALGLGAMLAGAAGFGLLGRGDRIAAANSYETLHEWHARAALLDERLTMLARLAAASGNAELETEYERAELELEETLAAVRRVLAEMPDDTARAVLAAIAATGASNAALVERERETFARVRAGDLRGAAEAVDSPDYRRLKAAYTHSMEVAHGRVMALVDEALLAEERRGDLAIALGIALATLAAGATLALVARSQHQLRDWARRAERLAEIARRTGQGVLLVDRSGRIEWVNEAFVRMTGYALADVRGHPADAFLVDAGGTPGERGARLARLLAGESPPVEIASVDRDGRPYVARVETARLLDLDGAPAGLVALLGDVSEQRRAEAEQRERERQFRALVHNIPGVAYRCALDERRTVRFVSAAVEAITGHPASHFEERGFESYAALVHPDDRAAHEAAIATAIANGGTYSLEYRILCGGEIYRWVRDRGQVVHEDDAPRWLDGAIFDVTDAKLAMQRVAESEERWNLALEGSGDGVWDWDAANGRVYFSRRWKQMLGYGTGEIGDQPAEWIDRLHPDDRPRALAEIERHLRGETESYGGEQRLRCKDGSYRWTLSRGKVIARDAGGRALRAVGIQTDISERKALEAELAQTRKLESIGGLAAGVAHEINTPVQFVGDNVHFLRGSFEDLLGLVDGLVALTAESGREAAAALEEKADYAFLRDEIPRALEQSTEGLARVARIVSALKDFSHPSGGEKSPVDLNHAVETTLVVCRNRWKYVADVETDFDPALPPVPCVRDEIGQVVLNLVVNAADAIAERVGEDPSGRGTIRISTRAVGERAELRVADDGAGIPDAIREQIYDPFFTTKEVGKGTGQGLAICRSVVVNRHGGELRCESEPGRGTTFTVLLPLVAER